MASQQRRATVIFTRSAKRQSETDVTHLPFQSELDNSHEREQSSKSPKRAFAVTEERNNGETTQQTEKAKRSKRHTDEQEPTEKIQSQTEAVRNGCLTLDGERERGLIDYDVHYRELEAENKRLKGKTETLKDKIRKLEAEFERLKVQIGAQQAKIQSVESDRQSLLKELTGNDQEAATTSRSDNVERTPDSYIAQLFRDIVLAVKDTVHCYAGKRKCLKEVKAKDLRKGFPERDLAINIRIWRHIDEKAERHALEAWLWLRFIDKLFGPKRPALWEGDFGQIYHQHIEVMEDITENHLPLSFFTSIRSSYADAAMKCCKVNDAALRPIAEAIAKDLELLSCCKDLGDEILTGRVQEGLRVLQEFQRTTAALRPYLQIELPRTGMKYIRETGSGSRNCAKSSAAVDDDSDEMMNDGASTTTATRMVFLDYTLKLKKTGHSDGERFDETLVIYQPERYRFTVPS